MAQPCAPYDPKAKGEAIREVLDAFLLSPIESVCPECGELAHVTVTNSGVQPGTVHGPEVHWFEGDGECTACTWRGEISDSS